MVAFFAALGASVWLFTKLQNRTGAGNSKNAASAAGIAFLLIFIVVFTVGHTLLK